ncbi:ABC transporter permease [Mesorhizobium sp. ORS 3428]|uniref:ABC transporter permease n=1 Tax=Mesorhizobium sp. ORS 3428 TaxID=540997 RepID=UPI0008DB2EBC|nr:ABC transporter permease [Mesorhizobium sp. ORS 3428]OHV89876.1 ABC transporter permease [Mesorhizobium sp. ORS 3428]
MTRKAQFAVGSVTLMRTNVGVKIWRNLLRKSWAGALAGVVLLWVIAGLVTGELSWSFLIANATIAGLFALAGTAQMAVLASGSGNIDLSLPYVVTFSAYVMSAGVLGQDNVAGSVLLSVLVGALTGAVNVALIVRLRIPAIVATLASGYILYSLTVSIQNWPSKPVGGMFEAMLRARFAGLTGVLIVAALILAVVGVLLSRTVFGLQFHAMGQNAEVARLAGVRRGWVLLGTFVLAGVLEALLGVLLATYQGGVSADLGRAYLLGSVAAVVIGGTRPTGGVTSVFGTAVGALVLTLAQSDLILLNFGIGTQYIIQGLIVLSTVCLVAARSPDRR